MPLRIGDRVLVQNQTGRFATKWDKTGKVVDIHQHDQYSVKIDGSGRLTLRNRQFLRKMTEHNILGDTPKSSWPNSVTLLEPSNTSTNNTGTAKPSEDIETCPHASQPLTVASPGRSSPTRDDSPINDASQTQPPDLPIINEPEQVNQELPSHVPAVSEPPNRPKANSSALQREMKRIGGYNAPGLQESPLPTTRTRSGRILDQ